MKTSEDDFIIRSSCRYRTLLKIRFGVSVLRKINLMKSYFYLVFHYQLFNGLNKKSGAKSLDPVYLLITLNSGLVCDISSAKKKKQTCSGVKNKLILLSTNSASFFKIKIFGSNIYFQLQHPK